MMVLLMGININYARKRRGYWVFGERGIHIIACNPLSIIVSFSVNQKLPIKLPTFQNVLIP